MLDHWQFSYAAIIGGAILPLFYLIVRQLKRFSAWANREAGPKERVGVYIIIFVVAGIFIGGMSQDLVDLGVSCYKQDKPVLSCMMESAFKNEKK